MYLSHPPVEFLTCLVCTQQFLGEREIAKKKNLQSERHLSIKKSTTGFE
jgi:hypothetical protein